jgi:hypothetical protein
MDAEIDMLHDAVLDDPCVRVVLELMVPDGIEGSYI